MVVDEAFEAVVEAVVAALAAEASTPVGAVLGAVSATELDVDMCSRLSLQSITLRPEREG